MTSLKSLGHSMSSNRDGTQPDLVVIGAGIGGSALATVMARAGLSVLLLEKSLEHRDVVRGEWIAPWGVAEVAELGLLDTYLDNGGHWLGRHTSYNEFMSREQAEAAAVVFDGLLPHKPLCMGHPKACNLLNKTAVVAGAEFKRGISKLRVTTGAPPAVDYSHDGEDFTVTPRWVVGADGRNGVVAKQIGCTQEHDEEHHLFSGMLVEGAYGWPEDAQVIATEGDANILAFPQGEGRVRIYLGWPSEERTLLVGKDGPKRFLEAWRLDCVPGADAIVEATPVSPCIAYPNYDSWVDSPVRPGVVLIGDAAGRNDPIIGQGLSISMRDVRQVRDALLGETDWREAMFEGYVTERIERMSRLRVSARLVSLRESTFGAEGRALRQGIHERIEAAPDLAAPFMAAFTGPEALPSEVFAPEFTTQIAGRPIWA